jgi:peptidoglycan/xylan/chitin deacetylase (PgdA/CDA1 family)
MQIKKMVAAIFCCCISLMAIAQTNTTWSGKKCAVVLTYDDAVQVDLDNVIPALDSLNFKGTFFVTLNYPAFKDNPSAWQKAAKHGHELGNHTLYHPCLGGPAGREWVGEDQDMRNYSLQKMKDELRLTNLFLAALDGKKERTFAFPCGDTKINDSPYLDKKQFVAARGVRPEMKKINEIDVYDIGCYGINGESGQQMIDLVKEAIKTNSLLVFLFHGVGGGHSINVSLEAHRQLLYFLKAHEKEIWIPTFIEAAKFITKEQHGKP